ncbi:HPP family protein [Engelhardtia mirabilis]|uniref:HPP family protein n=1 Tax=Engelhardtia mirabilis TaxID=2528011 RepID=A0A518BSN2_9BACT|nr:HPP family protein [Planctomycetes bacterium Pla133]QDV04290.1 HPP family protein [Planctomycetes bacterium Pla86]
MVLETPQRTEVAPLPALSTLRLALASGALMVPIGLLAAAADAAVLAPPLGVTAFAGLAAPGAESNRPRNVILGHGLGVALGMAALWVSGAARMVPALPQAFELRHVLSATLAVTLTAAATGLARTPHPPALATTLIFALGLLRTPADGLALMVGAGVVAGSLAVLRRRSGGVAARA